MSSGHGHTDPILLGTAQRLIGLPEVLLPACVVVVDTVDRIDDLPRAVELVGQGSAPVHDARVAHHAGPSGT